MAEIDNVRAIECVPDPDDEGVLTCALYEEPSRLDTVIRNVEATDVRVGSPDNSRARRLGDGRMRAGWKWDDPQTCRVEVESAFGLTVIACGDADPLRIGIDDT